MKFELPISAVAFDAAGTLIYPDPPAGEVYAETGRRHGSRLTAPEITDAFRRRFAAEETQDRSGRLQTSELREIERWRGIVRDVLHDLANPETCFQELYAHFSRPDAWKLYPDATETVARLLEAGWAVAVTSNFDRRLPTLCRAFPPLDRCAPLVISAEVGYRKPHPEFFARAARLVGQEPRRILHVGDDYENDYLGARGAGWQSVLVARRDARPSDRDA